MTKSNKIYNQVLNTVLTKENKVIAKINKTIKNKDSIKKCENVCITDYMKKPSAKFRKNYKLPYALPTELETKYMYTLCNKTICNSKCEGFDFHGNVKKQKEYKKNVKNGFINKFNTKQINALKKRGALSGCVYIADKDIFHRINGTQRLFGKLI